MEKCKESWIDGYKKGLAEKIDSTCFEAINTEIMARLAQENLRLTGALRAIHNQQMVAPDVAGNNNKSDVMARIAAAALWPRDA